MEKEYAYLLHLLGAYLRREVPETRMDVNWTKLVQLSQIHCVTGILGYLSMEYPICPDAELKKSLRSVCLNTLTLFARRNAMAQELSRDLSASGFDHVLMKGFVLRDFYPIPELRTFGDVDLVIRPEDRKRCHAWMTARGFHVETDWEPVYSYSRGEELYEIHSEIMETDVSKKADYRGYFRCLWEHAKAETPHDYRFTPEFHFLYLLTHIAKHIHDSGAGARMYLDVAAFVRHYGDGADWDWICGQLKQLQLYDFACVVLTAVERWFGVRTPVDYPRIPAEVLADFERFTMEAGVFGYSFRESVVSELKNASREETVPRVRQLLRRTFPKAETIQTRYTYLQDRPWLLPAAWIHRLVITRDSLGKHAREARNILQADAEEVHRLKRLMKQIGL